MKELIYDLIPTSKFITRSELKDLTNMCDREIRRIISEIKQEHTIISLSSGKGYRRVRSTDDMTQEDMIKEMEIIKHCINEINSRKKVYNKQLRQYIASLKVLQKYIVNTNE
jgi:DNA-binding XRE family transcriptional regulator